MNGKMERIYTQLCGYYEKRLWMMLKGLSKKKKHVICNWQRLSLSSHICMNINDENLKNLKSRLFRIFMWNITMQNTCVSERLLYGHHSSPFASTTKLALIIIQYFILFHSTRYQFSAQSFFSIYVFFFLYALNIEFC